MRNVEQFLYQSIENCLIQILFLFEVPNSVSSIEFYFHSPPIYPATQPPSHSATKPRNATMQPAFEFSYQLPIFQIYIKNIYSAVCY